MFFTLTTIHTTHTLILECIYLINFYEILVYSDKVYFECSKKLSIYILCKRLYNLYCYHSQLFKDYKLDKDI